MKHFFNTYWRTLLVLLLILYASTTRSTPDIEIAHILPHFDKIVHFGMYTVLSFAACYDRRTIVVQSWRQTLPVIILSILYGIIMELLQEYFFPPRTGSVLDCLANSVGSIAGSGLFLLFNRFKTKRP